MEDVIDEGDRISARFRYQGTFTNPFMGYRPNRAPVRMRSIDIWRVMDGKLAEHWDELNSQTGFAIHRNGGDGISASLWGQADANLGCLSDLVEFAAGRARYE